MNTMAYGGYTASMSFDAEDRILVGRVLDIADIIVFHGESVAEFEANFHCVVDDYIDACRQLGAVPEKPASGKLMLRIEPSVHAAAIKAAARSGTSLNKWAEHVISVAAGRNLASLASQSAGAKQVKAKPKMSRNRVRTSQTA
jgi:predicted HicB family RNase H-like nuclease